MIGFDLIVSCAAVLWLVAHSAAPSRYAGWFEIPSITRSLEGLRSETVLAVMPRGTVSEPAFQRALDTACPRIVERLGQFPRELSGGLEIPVLPDRRTAARLAQETGLGPHVEKAEIRVVAGGVRAKGCQDSL